MSKAKIKVLMALSGGVDSSVAAALLVASKKYDVTAAYMLNYDNNQKGSESCWLPDYRDALRVAAHLGIPFIKLDFTKEYKAQVLDYMYAEYEAGRTPNPDVLCNKFIKFGSWLDKAREMGFAFLSTGHYAKIKRVNDLQVALLEAKDKNKDQTYFLHQLNQEQLSRTMFPIGNFTKPEVRKLAKKFKLPTADKEESMGICFVGEVPMKEFLETTIKHSPGNIVTTDGKVIGTHDGLPFYTIGQRHIGVVCHPEQGEGSLKVNGRDSSATPAGAQNDSRPMYVVAKRKEANELVVGHEDDPALFSKEITVTDIHWIAGLPPKFPLQCEVRLRHRQALQKAKVLGDKVIFAKPERAVTPGQFAVFYKKGICLGGGVIA